MRSLKITLLLILLIALCSPSSFGDKNNKSTIDSRSTEIKDVKLNLVASLNLGLVVGGGADLIEELGGSFSDKFLYGGGLSLVYHTRSRFGLALNVSHQVKEIPGYFTSSGHGWLYSSSIIYNLRSTKRTIPYARFDVGLLSAYYPRTSSSIDLGDYSYIRLSFGLFLQNSGSLNMRCELLYQRAFSEGRTIDALGDYDIGFMAECIAVEIGFGIPLAWH